MYKNNSPNRYRRSFEYALKKNHLVNRSMKINDRPNSSKYVTYKVLIKTNRYFMLK